MRYVLDRRGAHVKVARDYQSAPVGWVGDGSSHQRATFHDYVVSEPTVCSLGWLILVKN